MPLSDSATPFSIPETRQHVEELMRDFDDRVLPNLTERIYDVPEGMARSVWQNKYSRRKDDKTFQNWSERVREVVAGSFMLDPPTRLDAGHPGETQYTKQEFEDTLALSLAGVMAYSGRHLQHGDWDQPNKKIEKFSNCSTGIFSFMTFKLGLDGSGVGSDYSNATRRTNWDNMPYVRVVLDASHPDFGKAFNEFSGGFDSLAEARLKYPSESEAVRWFDVEDTVEGWVSAIAALETAAFHEKHKEKTFIFNFTPVRSEGTPIKGQQGRPASGPIPLMRAFLKVASIRGSGMPPWKQALFIDHYLAASTILGGVRRMARMATKWWKDPDILEFIRIKRNVKETGVLWTANHSILVDAEFWEQAKDPRTDAALIFQAATAAAFMDRSGEPGFINVDKLNQRRDTLNEITAENYLNPDYGFNFHQKTLEMCAKVLGIVKKQKYFMIVNPCAEISLASYGGYCLVADVNGARVDTKAEFIKACGLMAKFLVRTNRMKAMYKAETLRTNRIGVSLLGIHEMAWNMFNMTFHDLIKYYSMLMDYTEDQLRVIAADLDQPYAVRNAINFWTLLSDARDEVEREAEKYSGFLGMRKPDTATCLKPGGTVSKIFVTTESANLPAYLYYMRWVQYEKDLPGQIGNPALQDLIDRGYPIQDISQTLQYPGKVVVGFPTMQPIAEKMGSLLVCASEASPEQHYMWLRLLEKFWLGGVNEDGSIRNNMISYTLKFQAKSDDQPNGVSYEEFRETILTWQSQIRCCSFDASQSIGELKSAHAYLPEEPINKEKYFSMLKSIRRVDAEAYDNNSLQCASGICPIEEDRFEAPELTHEASTIWNAANEGISNSIDPANKEKIDGITMFGTLLDGSPKHLDNDLLFPDEAERLQKA